MPEPDQAPGTPREWLSRARSHLTLAKTPKPDGVYWEEMAFHCQQAAELAIKAVYQLRGRPFAYTHDIADLLSTLASTDLSIPPRVKEALVLTKYASKSRYPGTFRPITEEKFRDAFRRATDVVSWAASIIDAQPTT